MTKDTIWESNSLARLIVISFSTRYQESCSGIAVMNSVSDETDEILFSVVNKSFLSLPGAMNGRTASENGSSGFAGYVPITTQHTVVVSNCVAKVTWPNGVPPPHGPYFEYPEQGQFHQY